tara:strand:+ start:29000 stop:30331 length:1332 start_codon:yes stop_codon:yes gene_type:complete
MKTKTRFKDYTVIQKLGTFLVITGGAITLAKILSLFTASHFVEEDLPNYLFLVGAFLIFFPAIRKRLSGKATKTTLILLFVFSTINTAFTQDYSKQIDAFKQSFVEKSVSPLKPYVSPELKFDPVPVANTPAVLNNIVSNLPKLNSMTIIESSQGMAKVKYDFVGLGVRESDVHFDESGKFTRIELIENLIKQEMEAQKKLQQSVQLPNPGELGKRYQPEKVEFKAADGLLVNGNLYDIGENKPVILLCHQAGYNRIEYADIAPKLNEMGYNCLAIDQRSGGNFAGKPNVSAEKAKESGLPNEMIDARQDIKAAIYFLHEKYKRDVIIWGSSYSASLALLEGVSNNKVKSIIAFSPGDYFGDAAPSLSTAFAKADKPFLVTSSKEEFQTLTSLIGNVKLTNKQTQFIPKSDGFHGSRALWTGQKGADEYWNAVTTFLKTTSKN